MKRVLLPLTLLAAAVATIVATVGAPRMALRSAEGPMLPNPAFLKAILPGHLSVTADFYWIQLIQQVGRALTAEDYRQSIYYAELVTELDPDFQAAYQFAALAIPFNQGHDTWVNVDETMQIIKKGLRRDPRDAALLRYLAHTQMFLQHDYRGAADTLKTMSTLPGALPHLAKLATRLYAQAGEYDAGLDFARAMAEQSADAEQRRFFEHRVKEIESERELTRVDTAAWTFFRREGRQPTGVPELLTAGDLGSPPVDPLGGDIVIDTYGRARTTASNFRLELYEDTSKKLAPGPEGSE